MRIAGLKGKRGAGLKVVAAYSATYDPASIADAAILSVGFVVPGARRGDFVLVSHSAGPATSSLVQSAYVSDSDTVVVTWYNRAGGPVDMASGTLRIVVLRGEF